MKRIGVLLVAFIFIAELIMNTPDVFAFCEPSEDQPLIETHYDKYYPIFLDQEDISDDFRQSRRDLKSQIPSDPERLKQEENKLKAERKEKESALLEKAGVTKEEFTQFMKDCMLNHPELTAEYLESHPELIERNMQQFERRKQFFKK